MSDRDGAGAASGGDGSGSTDRSEPAEANDPARDRQNDPARVVAFTDGVFAIIITVLVLEIGVPPDLSRSSFLQVLEDLRPTLVAWLISFMLTGMYWVMHRDLFAHVRVASRDVVWLNLLFLLPTCLIPFASSVLGEYPEDPVALQLYGIILIAASFMRIVLAAYLSRRPHLLFEPVAPSRLRFALLAAPIPVYLVAMVVAAGSTTVALVLYLLLPAMYFLLVTVLRERPRSRADADQFS